MTAILLGAAIVAILAMFLIGSRTFKLGKVRERMRTPVANVPVQPVTYFERYQPKKASGLGDAL